ncbi:Uma2 family endonuclease [Streptomyces sp. PKU-MA01144]|uniref:Uma2 family endonuclease n=1 Tax=Streptomyces sp. PKU-MA01144 TaxID=2729138 RepID=UPI00147D4852|nr:Uma2 family endonuclease [Streptomyces sp. PKU-MA01144]NNJ03205.1 Uma2 family endonuclease [Streptomyces sp. PKU-MA01144]
MMTVVETDRIEMAESDNERTLDEMFEALERMPVPEGYKVEIVEGTVFMSPQRDAHWDLIAAIYDQLRAQYPRKRIKSDVRVDYPGHLNGFATDLTLLRGDAEKNAKGLWCHEDVVLVVEVVSRSTGANDYGPKKRAYATAEVPVYLIADPYVGRCHVYTQPKGGDYLVETAVAFGADVDLTGTPVALTLATGEFPRG